MSSDDMCCIHLAQVSAVWSGIGTHLTCLVKWSFNVDVFVLVVVD